MDIYDNEKKQDLDKYKKEGKRKDVEYIFFPFVIPLPISQKESNHPTNMGKKKKIPNHLIYISKIR